MYLGICFGAIESRQTSAAPQPPPPPPRRSDLSRSELEGGNRLEAIGRTILTNLARRKRSTGNALTRSTPIDRNAPLFLFSFSAFSSRVRLSISPYISFPLYRCPAIPHTVYPFLASVNASTQSRVAFFFSFISLPHAFFAETFVKLAVCVVCSHTRVFPLLVHEVSEIRKGKY